MDKGKTYQNKQCLPLQTLFHHFSHVYMFVVDLHIKFDCITIIIMNMHAKPRWEMKAFPCLETPRLV